MKLFLVKHHYDHANYVVIGVFLEHEKDKALKLAEKHKADYSADVEIVEIETGVYYELGA